MNALPYSILCTEPDPQLWIELYLPRDIFKVKVNTLFNIYAQHVRNIISKMVHGAEFLKDTLLFYKRKVKSSVLLTFGYFFYPAFYVIWRKFATLRVKVWCGEGASGLWRLSLE
jgi:hypothetical protein